MRFAIQNPDFLFHDPVRNFNGYNLAFVRKFKPAIYLTRWRSKRRYQTRLRELGFEAGEIEFYFTQRSLNRDIDALLCFNGWPYLEENVPPRKFRGLKVWHVMDYVFRATESNRILCENGVDYVMGYTDHGAYCPFFQAKYPDYEGKVISVPFGFSERFHSRGAFADRIPRVLAMGAVNPVDDPKAPARDDLKEYVDFYRHEQWTHRWRRALVENKIGLEDIVENRLPVFPETKNYEIDSPNELARFALFANDPGLLAFPPARTYEGAASGALMVCEDHPSIRSLGFQGGVNCLLHARGDIPGFRRVVTEALRDPDRLAAMAQAGMTLVRTHYNHESIASSLHLRIQSFMSTGGPRVLRGGR